MKRKLTKSTLILLPLFSIYYIAFSVWQPFVSGKLSAELELIRLYFEIICSSFQGLIISFIYCFFNSEVRTEILNQIERKLLQRYPNMRRFSTIISKDRQYSCASIERAKQKSEREKRMKSLTAESVNIHASNQEMEKSSNKNNISNNIDLNSIHKQDLQSVDLNSNHDKNKKLENIFNFFKRIKKGSRSTNNTSNFTISSKSSKATIRIDSLDINNNANSNFNNISNSINNLNGLSISPANSSLRINKAHEQNNNECCKSAHKVSFADINVKEANEECANLLDQSADDEINKNHKPC